MAKPTEQTNDGNTSCRDARLLELLDRVMDLVPEERETFLEAQCGPDPAMKADIEAILAQEGNHDWLDQCRFPIASAKRSQRPKIERYEIIRELGVGGMGTVYLAERNDGHFQHKVALKVLNHSLNSEMAVARFRFERQILANLNHEFIATLIDGGMTADGRPYFVMRLVEGITLNAYCKAGKGDFESKLDLFEKICNAVQFAHGHRVIHGDIKPSNIMVTQDGAPVLLDFGVAKFLEDTPDDGTTQPPLPFTPEYASPEQVAGHAITTATDIHALGLLLFKLLTGRAPFPLSNQTIDEWRQHLQTSYPLLLGKYLAPHYRRSNSRELDRILRRALQKEPHDRYPSAEALAQDVWRFRNHFPLQAREPSVWYVLQKFLRRRVKLASAFALLAVVAMVTLFVVRHQTKAIALSQIHAAQTAAMLFEVFESEDPYRDSKQQPALALIRLAETQLGQTAISKQQRADLHDALGKAHYYLGTLSQARSHLEKAVDLRLANGNDRGADSAKTFYHLGLLAMAEQQWPTAETHFQKARQCLAGAPPGHYPTLVKIQHKRLALMMHQGQWEAAQALVETFGSEHLAKDTHLEELKLVIQAENLARNGELLQAEATYRALGDLQRHRLPTGHPLLGATLNNLAGICYRRGAYSQAVAAYSQAFENFRQRLGAHHPDVATARKNLADAQLAMGACDPAAVHYEEALAIRQRIFGSHHPLVAEVLARQQAIALDEADILEALRLGEALWQICESHFGPLAPQTMQALLDLINLGCESGDLQRQAEYAKIIFPKLEATYGPESNLVADVLVKNAKLDIQRGEWVAVPEPLWRAHEIFKANGETESQKATLALLQTVMMNLARQACIHGVITQL